MSLINTTKNFFQKTFTSIGKMIGIMIIMLIASLSVVFLPLMFFLSLLSVFMLGFLSVLMFIQKRTKQNFQRAKQNLQFVKRSYEKTVAEQLKALMNEMNNEMNNKNLFDTNNSFCYCGSDIELTAIFCWNCGIKL